MFSLWVFGRTLENIWGPKRFLLFYFLCGLGSAVAHSVVQYFQFQDILQVLDQAKAMGDTETVDVIMSLPIFAVGASGAVMGVMVAFAYLFPNTELLLYFAIPVKAKWVILALIAFDLIYGLGKTRTGIAHWAHLGGAATGFLLVYIWNKTNKKTFY
jgi:rhomboid-like protein